LIREWAASISASTGNIIEIVFSKIRFFYLSPTPPPGGRGCKNYPLLSWEKGAMGMRSSIL